MISAENFKVNRESLNRQNKQMTVKPVPTSGRSKVTSVPKEETFFISLKYIDVARSTHTDLEVMQENGLMIIGMSI